MNIEDIFTNQQWGCYFTGELYEEFLDQDRNDFKIMVHGNNLSRTLTITDYRGTAKDLIIPDTIEGMPVTGIGDMAFIVCWRLTSISLPGGLTAIGDSAFSWCIGLSNISFPAQLTTIGERAFYGCTGLNSINLPVGLTTIGERAFYGCTGLNSINLPAGLTTIGEQAFYGCSELSSITIPASVTSIGYNTFGGCSKFETITFSINTQIGRDILKGVPGMIVYNDVV